MINIIDGLQLAGKTTLIKEVNKDNQFKVYKFDFSYYSKLFNINKSKIGSFQLGKDLSMLYFLKDRKDENIIVDRGIFSTIYYSLLYKRLKKIDIINLFNIIEREYFNYNFIFVIKINDIKNENKRDKKDGYDKLNKKIDSNILNFIIKQCYERQIKFTVFFNNYYESIEENSKRLKYLLEDYSKNFKEHINEHFGNKN